MWSLKNWRRRRVLRRFRLSEAQWREVVAGAPVLHRLNEQELDRLRQLAVLFLHEKSLEAAGGLELTDAMRLGIAARACLPILNLGLDFYEGWVSVVIYPAGFRGFHQRLDAAGVMHSERFLRSGEAWERGPLILSWADVAGAGSGHNVLLHEFAHKLDMLNGVANGMPPLHPGMEIAAWTRAFTQAYADLCQRLHAGLEVAINPYAAESPAEFFAVASEAFFETPASLRDAYPEVYDQLRAFYRQDPAARCSRYCA